MHNQPTRKVAPRASKRKPKKPSTPHGLLVLRAVRAGIRELSQYRGNAETREHYYRFRIQKRRIYELFPDQPRKAQAIVRFVLARAGWAPGPS